MVDSTIAVFSIYYEIYMNGTSVGIKESIASFRTTLYFLSQSILHLVHCYSNPLPWLSSWELNILMTSQGIKYVLFFLQQV